jgi:CRISPR-associated protein Csm3
MSERIHLLGRFTIRAEIHAQSGLSIGGGGGGPGWGGDESVARDLLTGEPYVPGSSLKGKMRALTERALGSSLAPAFSTQSRRETRLIHRCASEKDYRAAGALPGYQGCPVCHLYGTVPLDFPVLPTRLITRDAPLSEASRKVLEKRRTELPFTEVKTESVLDRLSAAATPRQRERVPAGAVFDARWDLSAYALDGADLKDEKLLAVLFAGLRLLEDDYLGGQGSRGYGRIELFQIRLSIAHDGGLSAEARELASRLGQAEGVTQALAATGNPLERQKG